MAILLNLVKSKSCIIPSKIPANITRTRPERSQELAKHKCREPYKVENTVNTENESFKCSTAHKMTIREFHSINIRQRRAPCCKEDGRMKTTTDKDD